MTFRNRINATIGHHFHNLPHIGQRTGQTLSLRRRLARPIFLLVLMMMGVVRPVLAHGYLLRAIPEDRAVLQRAPARLQYWFSEPMEPAFTTLTVRDQTGTTIATGGVSPDNNTLVTVRMPRDITDGAYIVDMRLAFASDGHVIVQSRVFFIGESVSAMAGQAASDEANGLEVVWRTLLYASTILLFGIFTLYAGVLVPAWGNENYRAGLLPPRVMRRLSWLIAGSLVAAVVGNGLALLQQAMAFFNTDLAGVISGGLWSAARAGTRFGDLWTARMLLLVVVSGAYAASLYFREEQPEVVRPSWTASAWAMALMIGTFSAGSHAAGSLLWPWVGVAVDWLHALAVGFWAGGLGALVLILPTALAPYEGEARRLALLAPLRRFSRMATACVAIVVTTGIYSALNWIYSPTDITQTTYGKALMVKLVLVAGLLLVGLAHHSALRPERYQRLEGVVRRLGGFGRTPRLEVMVAVLVLVSVGLLSATPVPIPDFVQESVPAPSQSETIGDEQISMTITPGGPGVNTYDIHVTRDDEPVDGLAVQVQIVDPARDWRGAWLTAEDAESGLYVAAGDELAQTGKWWALVNLTRPDGSFERVAFDWSISDEAAIQETREPGLLNLLALAGALVAIGWVLYPSGKRLYATLDLSPAAVTVAASAVVATVFFGVLGFVLVNNSQAQYEATLNPPPQVVNTVLPDEASLERGQSVYQTACMEWADESDLRLLLERVSRARDDELFVAVRDGWRGLPACETVSDPERWDVVNFIRVMNMGFEQ